MRRALTTLALLIGAVACERPVAPPHAQTALNQQQLAGGSTETLHPQRTQGSAASPSGPVGASNAAASERPSRCIVALAEPAAPRALPARNCPESPEAAPKLAQARVIFLDAPGQPSVSVEIADSLDEKARGLMYRQQLGSDRGMLFPYSGETVHSFWMRNTCIPLDMLFIGADDVVVGLLEQVPTINDAARSIACPSRDVLEVNAGWSRANGVRPGQRVRIDR